MDILYDAYYSLGQVGRNGNASDFYSVGARCDSPPILSWLWGFPGFPQFLQESNGTVPKITGRQLSPTSL
jgi:hypothetical protein